MKEDQQVGGFLRCFFESKHLNSGLHALIHAQKNTKNPVDLVEQETKYSRNINTNTQHKHEEGYTLFRLHTKTCEYCL